jgi:hypothetical protein
VRIPVLVRLQSPSQQSGYAVTMNIEIKRCFV